MILKITKPTFSYRVDVLMVDGFVKKLIPEHKKKMESDVPLFLTLHILC